MPKKKISVLKRARQSEKRRERNSTIKSKVKTIIKKTKEIINQGPAEEAKKALLNAIEVIDKARSSGVIHRNKAARLKSQLQLLFNKTLVANEK